MNTIFVVILLAIVGLTVLYTYLKSPGGHRAALSATPMGAYLRARDKGATAEQAIFDAIQILRYREPWVGLSEADLSAAASTLAALHDPKLFTAVVVEVEESGSLNAIRNRGALDQFVLGANSLPQKF